MARLRCLWWNVNNLFPYDAAAKPDRWRPPSESDYQGRLGAISGILSGAPGGLPDLILLSEVAVASQVGGRDALAELRQVLGCQHDYYLGTHGDDRGITCGAMWSNGLMLDRSGVRLHDVVGPSSHVVGRPIIELPFGTSGGSRRFVVYLNHWTSRGEGTVAEGKRRAAGEDLVKLVQARVCTSVAGNADPASMLVAVGDFNDEPFDASLTDPGGAGDLWVSRDRTQVLTRQSAADFPVLYNPSWRLLAERKSRRQEIATGTDVPPGSFLYNGQWWRTFDQVLVSAGMLYGANPAFDEDDLEIHAPPQLVGADGGPNGSPSDHFPLSFALDL